ncbi:MAG: copper-binding protein [Alphaproteobacteria bacterium GM7ARS4]|nr:copper-binding protein [Alphaproteobacteria bacterium GM7ARS4]
MPRMTHRPLITLPAIGLFALATMATPTHVYSTGDLAIRATGISLQLGNDKSDYAVEPKTISLETGKAYALDIISHGFKEYRFRADRFFQNVWIRKIEAEGVELNVAGLLALEFEEEYEEVEVSIVFVPIRTGDYPFTIEGFESRGMEGVFSVR